METMTVESARVLRVRTNTAFQDKCESSLKIYKDILHKNYGDVLEIQIEYPPQTFQYTTKQRMSIAILLRKVTDYGKPLVADFSLIPDRTADISAEIIRAITEFLRITKV